VAVASAGLYATLTPFDLEQGLPLRATHGFTFHSTHPQSSFLHGAVKAGSLSEIEKRALPPPCFPSFNFQSTQSQGDSEWQWHLLGYMQVCTSSQTTTPTSHHSVFLRARCPSCRPTNSVKALKAGKTNQDLLEQEIVSGSGISWAICKSAP